MRERNLDPQVVYCKSDQQIVKLYPLIHVTGRLGQPTSRSPNCAVTIRLICYIAMTLTDVSGNCSALPHIEPREVVKLSCDWATTSNRQVDRLYRHRSLRVLPPIVIRRLCQSPHHERRQVVKLSRGRATTMTRMS